jgi:hypothetical protein
MSWLKHPDVRKDVETVVKGLSEQITGRRATASESYQTLLEATVVAKSLSDGSSLKREWFFSSLGLEWDDGDRETWYLTRSGAPYFSIKEFQGGICIDCPRHAFPPRPGRDKCLACTWLTRYPRLKCPQWPPRCRARAQLV